MPVTAVATACGYVTPSRFSAAYRGRFGCAPRDDRAGERRPPQRRADAHPPRLDPATRCCSPTSSAT